VELALDQRRLRMTQVIGEAMLEQRLRERIGLDGQALERIEEAVLARVQHGDEVGLAEQQRAFVLLDEELAEHGGLPKSDSKNESGMGLPAGGRAAALRGAEHRSRAPFDTGRPMKTG
jgi:hypothetical protein